MQRARTISNKRKCQFGPRVRGSERIGAIKRGGVNTQEERHNLVRRVWNKLRKIQKFSQAERGGALGGWARLAGGLDLGLEVYESRGGLIKEEDLGVGQDAASNCNPCSDPGISN